MTREEIIDGLEIYTVGRLNKDRVHITMEELQKFIDAIKSLEQEPCGDCISRQAVLEIFGYVMDYWKEHAIDVEPHEIEDALIEQYEFTAKKLSELPPVNPHENAISLEKVIEWLKAKDIIKPFSQEETARKELKALLPVNPQPKTGHWFIDERPESNRETICSNCEQPVFKYHKLDFDYRPKYCPNCGARMIEPQESEHIGDIT